MDREYLLNIPYKKYKEIFYKFRDYLKTFNNGKYYHLFNGKDIEFKEDSNTLSVFVIRCNDYYITNDMQRNNDFLILLYSTPSDKYEKYVFDVTADPKTRRYGIANLMEQIYVGNVRNHKWTLGRDCIAQDLCPVWVRRYTSNTNYYEEKGHFGINIHNNGGLFNSSLGCVIFADDEDYFNYFRKIVRTIDNKKEIPVAVIRDNLFLKFLNNK